MPSSSDPASARPPFRNILIVRQHDQLGDMLCAVPLMRALRASSPSAHSALVTSPVNHAIMLHHPYLDEVIEYDKRKVFRPGEGVLGVLRRIRSRRYDLAVVPSTVSVSTTSSVIARCSGAALRIGAKSLDGVDNPFAWCFTAAVDLGWRDAPHRHQAGRNLDILAPVGISTDDLTHCIGLTPRESERAREELAPLREDHRLVIGFHPGAGKPPNRWSAERFARLAERAAENYGAGIVVTQGPMDDGPVTEMLRHLRTRAHVVNNRPIRDVAAIIDTLDLYVTNDTGVMHLAGATSPHVLALFGPTDPLQWAPVGGKNRYLMATGGDLTRLSLEEVEGALEVVIMDIRRNLKLA